MPDTKLKQLIINECSSIPETFELNQLYLTPDTTEEDILNAVKESKEYTDNVVDKAVKSIDLSGYATKTELNTKLSIDTKYGSSLSLTIDNQSYILTAQLKDQNGDNIGTAQTVDLPLETMVVGAEYDENTKELVITLKNGETVRFSIADLVSGLQPTITDLDTIRIGAEKGATAVQPGELAKVSTSGSYNDLSNKPVINNGTLTIQKNGSTVGTFTANQAGASTVNINVPTKTSELTNNSDFTTKAYVDGVGNDIRKDLGQVDNNIIQSLTAVEERVVLHGEYISLLRNKRYANNLSYANSLLQLKDQDGKALGDAVLIEATGGGSSNTLFDFKWADHTLDDVSWLRSDTFSWHDGNLYKAAFDHLYADASYTRVQTETISGNTIRYILTEDGHKIVDAGQESIVQAIYEATGIAWYYIVDGPNKRFKLPRTKWGFAGLRNAVGNYVPESLPDHLHNLSVNGTYDGVGSFYGTAGKADYAQAYTAKTQLASVTSPVYGGTEVQQRATQMYLYFYVGAYTKTAIEQTAGITAETLNSKLDMDLGNATATAKSTIVGLVMPYYSGTTTTGLTGSPLSSTTKTYTCPKNGWFNMQANKSSAGNTIYVAINGIVRHQEAAFSATSTNMMYPVNKGDVIRIYTDGATANWSVSYANFIPSIGG